MTVTENTKINLGLVSAICTLVFSFGIFYSVASQTTERVVAVEKEVKDLKQSLNQMSGDIRVLRCSIVKDCK